MAIHDRPRTVPRGADTPVRRTVDVVLALAALLVLAPVLLVIAALVAVESPGPAIYRQERVGRGGHPFMIWKFRTMVDGADRHGALVSGRADPRVTAIGRLLRPTRLDELPQLVNIVRGEMTLVGPRPEVVRYVRHYTAAERAVLTVRPGVLGAGAILFVESQAGELDAAADPEKHYLRCHLHPKLALDLAYLAERGLRNDLRLAGRTIVLLLGTHRSRPA